MAVNGQNCGNCGFSWSHLADQLVSCGAPVDDAALHGEPGVNPVWAERKYSRLRILAVLLGGADTEPHGSNPERLSRDDGTTCKMWRAKSAIDG